MIFSRFKKYKDLVAIETQNGAMTFEKYLEKIALAQQEIKSRHLPDKIALIMTRDELAVIFFLALLSLGKKIYLFSSQEDKKNHLQALKQYHISYLLKPFPLPSFPLESDFLQESFEQAEIFLFSSGTTKAPKLIKSSFKAHLLSAQNAVKALALSSSSRYLLSLPTHHVSGLSILFRSFISLSTLVIDYRFNKTPYHVLKTKNISHLSCVQTQLSRLLKEYESLLPKLKAILVGGSSIPEILIKKAYEKKLPILLSYGMTETCSMICCNHVLKTKNFTSCGLLPEHVKIKFSQQGEIQISSEVLFDYYIDHENKIIKRDLFFKTSDIGYLDQQKHFYISHRKDDIFFYKGYNISPKKVETVLLSFPNVEKAKVIALLNYEFGHVPFAFYFAKKPIDKTVLLSFLKNNLETYEVPRDLFYFDFHISETGKVLASEIKKMLNFLQNRQQ